MQSFIHLCNPKVIFGNGKITELASLIQPEQSPLILTGKHFVSSQSWFDIKTQLNTANIKFSHQFVSGEPTPQMVDQLTLFAKSQQHDLIIAIGGGSVLDAGKAVAAMVCHQGSVTNYLEGVGKQTPSKKTLPFIAVPTTAGTGSEATKNAVISQKGEQAFKKSLRHDAYLPPIALIDPQLSVGTPELITLACAMDAFCQLLEALVSTKATPFTDALAIQGITLFAQGSRLFRENLYGTEQELGCRGQLALAAYLSGLSLANAGLGTVHGIAGPLGATCHIPHGAACGLLLAPVFGKLLEKSPMDKFTLARNILFPKANDNRQIIAQFAQWAAPLGKLSDYGFTEQDIEYVVNEADNKNSPIQLDDAQMAHLLRQLL